MKASRSRGQLEAEILACLGAASGPMTAREVQAELDGDLAYTSVMTILTRLYDKQALHREPRGRAYAYSLAGGPAGARANITAHQMHRLLADGADRAGVLTRFVAELSPADERLLARLLGPADGKK